MNDAGELVHFTLGEPRGLTQQVVPLGWSAQEIVADEHGCLTAQLELSNRPGIYAVEGRHSAYGEKAVLYIGQTTKLLKDRATSSLGDLFVWTDEQQPTHRERLYSDVWDVTVRVAYASTARLNDIERALIAAHSPPFNSHGVRREWLPRSATHLLILNVGNKGRLLPVVAGLYYSALVLDTGGSHGPEGRD